jgi:viroplasmin and RNaseH domain-containing protein
MNIDSQIEELKKNNSLIQSLQVDYEFLQQLTPQVLNYRGKKTDEYNAKTSSLIKICERLEQGAKDLKVLVNNKDLTVPSE